MKLDLTAKINSDICKKCTFSHYETIIIGRRFGRDIKMETMNCDIKFRVKNGNCLDYMAGK